MAFLIKIWELLQPNCTPSSVHAALQLSDPTVEVLQNILLVYFTGRLCVHFSYSSVHWTHLENTLSLVD